MELDEAKYKMIIRYLTRRYIGQIGKTQLYKILFFVDMDHSKTHKKTLTGDTYIKNTYGPTPKAVETVLNELKEDGYITVMKQDTPDGREKHLILNIKEYTDDELNNALSAAELESIVRRGNYCMGKNSEELSDITHQSSVFDSLDFQEEIPNYILPYYFDEPITEREKSELDAKYLQSS